MLSLLVLVSLAVSASAANFKRVACPDGVNTATNAACCAFFSLRDDLLANLFDEGCSEEVHESLRLTFHDAIAFSPMLTAQGQFGGTGADGSPILFPDIEPNFHANLGISDAVDFLTPFLDNHNVTAADLVQFAGALGVTQCQGAPALEFLAGRPNAQQVPPDGLVPEPQDTVDSILARFADAGGFTSDDVVSLLVSHTIARADHVDATLNAAPFDSTPFTFDTQFFLETQLRGVGFPGTGGNQGEVQSPLPLTVGDQVGELRLQSDHNFARDSRTSCLWQSFVTDQRKMASMFAEAFKKMAILGHNREDLVDCSEVLPPPAAPVTKPPTFPATKSNKDIEQACATTPFPTLSSDPGAAETIIPHCPDGLDTCGDS